MLTVTLSLSCAATCAGMLQLHCHAICKYNGDAMSNTTKLAQLQHLTLQQLEAWVGATIMQRGKAYQRSGRARKLALTADGALLAWVSGTQRYATLVDVVKGTPLATCSCPYDSVCKHAVAVVLACQMPDVRGHALPTVSENDRRFAVLEAAGEEWDEDRDEDDDDLDDGVWDAAKAQKSGCIGPTVIPAGDTAVAALRSSLEKLSKDQLGRSPHGPGAALPRSAARARCAADGFRRRTCPTPCAPMKRPPYFCGSWDGPANSTANGTAGGSTSPGCAWTTSANGGGWTCWTRLRRSLRKRKA